MNEIKGFFGKYRWLSNFWYAPVMYGGIIYPTNEHAYQAAKTDNEQLHKEVLVLTSPMDVKKWGYTIRLKSDWDSIKYGIMKSIVVDKFTRNKHLTLWLIATKDAYLEETNTWNDTYWGVSGGIGLNNLGNILMEVRSELSLKTE